MPPTPCTRDNSRNERGEDGQTDNTGVVQHQKREARDVLRYPLDYVQGLIACGPSANQEIRAVDVTPHRARLIETPDEIGHIEDRKEQRVLRWWRGAVDAHRVSAEAVDNYNCSRQDHPSQKT